MDNNIVKTNEKKARNPKRLPLVRQTLTSRARLLQANPLLRYEEAGVDIDKLLTAHADNEKLERPSLPPYRAFENIFERMTNGGGSRKPDTFVRSQSLKLPKGTQKPIVNLNVNRPSSKVSTHTKQCTVTSQQNKSTNFVRPTASSIISANPVKPFKRDKIPVSNKEEKVLNNPSGRPSITNKVLPRISYKPPTAIKSRYLQPVTSAATNKITDKTKKAPEENKDGEKKGKKPALIRRSLSSGHLQTRKGKQFDPQVAFTKLNTTRSEENINVPVDMKPMFSPILEEGGSKKFIFKTPSAHERRSTCARGRRSFQSSTPAVVGDHQQTLAKQLSSWLEKRGKRLSEFKHLRCFGVHNQKEAIASKKELFVEENKENIEVSNDHSDSFEDLRIDESQHNASLGLHQNGENNDKNIPKIFINDEESPKKCAMNCKQSQIDLHLIAKDALKELNKVIEEGYPKDHCISWLELIRDKFTELEEEPEYWECRAAIEKTEGNIGNAVECYKTAIMHGAEVNAIEESLDCLLKKFSLLHISPNTQPDRELRLRRREKIEQDARNVFKSTIIQFALETRVKKTDEKQHLPIKKPQVTPVRRSTRLSRFYTSTSGVQLYDSLKELSPDNYDFKRNKALI